MDGLSALCKELDLPQTFTDAIREAAAPDEETQKSFIKKLTSPTEYAEGAKELGEFFQSDPNGISVLRVLLISALCSRQAYRAKAIPDEIFLATMKCFSRFVLEHRESYGSYGFDRAFWVGRQLSLLLFRIGELEYEMTEYEGEKALSVHIPSDADLTPDLLDESFSNAQAFFKRYFPEYENAVFFCNSWLLSPALNKLLPERSRILLFQKRFRLVSFDENAEGYKQWVFKNRSLAPEQFPEDTSLQRNMKQFVLNGGKIGEAIGICHP